MESKEYKALWYKKNAESVKKRRRERYQENREREKFERKVYYMKNAEEIKRKRREIYRIERDAYMRLSKELKKLTRSELEQVKYEMHLVDDEAKVFDCLAEGYSVVKTATTCSMSTSTVSNRIRDMLVKYERVKK